MIFTVAIQEPSSDLTQSNESRFSSRSERRPDRVLIAEHRDEVFARLAGDLRECGYTVFRASCVDDVCRMYTYGQIELVLFNYQLPCDDIWLRARRLRVFDAYARIWLYVPSKTMLEPRHSGLHCIERVVEYAGDLLQLADEINANLDELKPNWSAGTPHLRNNRSRLSLHVA